MKSTRVLGVVLRAEAREELDEAIGYLEAARPGMGMRFFADVETRFEWLSRFPKIGHRVGPKARRLTMRKWRYSIIYSVEPNCILVAAIAHHSRRPGYWRHRLRRSMRPPR